MVVGEALADHTAKDQVCALSVLDTSCRAVGVAEVIFRQIAVQVLLAAMLVDAPHPALEDAEVAFDGVGVDGAAHVLARAVVHALMVGNVERDEAIDGAFVGHDASFAADVGGDNRFDFVGAHLVHDV